MWLRSRNSTLGISFYNREILSVSISELVHVTECGSHRVLASASHHRSVDGADAVVAHVQRGQVSPHGNDSCDRAARLRPFRLPLGELARLRDQDRLNVARTRHAKLVHGTHDMHEHVYCSGACSLNCTIIVSVEWWILRVARLDLRDDRP